MHQALIETRTAVAGHFLSVVGLTMSAPRSMQGCSPGHIGGGAAPSVMRPACNGRTL